MSRLASSSSPSLLESVVNHVAFPPKLPQRGERNIENINNAITLRLRDAARALRDITDGPLSEEWERVRFILQNTATLNDGNKLDKTSLIAEFRRLSDSAVSTSTILYIAEQNAGLLIRQQDAHDANPIPSTTQLRVSPGGSDEEYPDGFSRSTTADNKSINTSGRYVQDENVVIEAFEASPPGEVVLAAENTLQWDFPGCAVAIPRSEFNNASFQEQLASFLERASTESIKQFAARATKAGAFAFESRDTADPALITTMLMTLLEVNGHRVSPPLLRKRVRDDIIFSEGARQPWRRSPYWLVLRVGIEKHLRTVLGSDAGRIYYKFLRCLMLAHIIDESAGKLNLELVSFLNQKLGRRLVKLESDKERAARPSRSIYESMFALLGTTFKRTLARSNERTRAIWNNHKRTIRRPIYKLPQFADGGSQILTLKHSSSYLQQVFLERRQVIAAHRMNATQWRLPEVDVSEAQKSRFAAFRNRYITLATIEEQLENNIKTTTSSDKPAAYCQALAKEIHTYLDAIGDAYDHNPMGKSSMLLIVMELWMLMDMSAIALYPLLRGFVPGFPPEILNVLTIPQYEDMLRLNKIQAYLQRRYEYIRKKADTRTIFDEPAPGCFAEKYFDMSQELGSLLRKIEAGAELARNCKEEEWQRLKAEFESLQVRISESTCVFTTGDFGERIHDDKRCTKCYLQRRSRRMTIQIHEHPLPSNIVHAKAIVFELGCPKPFIAYRDATWTILGVLARSKQPKHEAKLLLCDYGQLKPFKRTAYGTVTLASRTKSFLDTHYRGIRFPVEIDDVCLPNGLKIGYYHSVSGTWTSQVSEKPTFAHHCPILIPRKSPLSPLLDSPDFAVDRDGPTSNAVIASQTRCPPGLNIQEFLSYQSLFSGKTRRWIALLVEIGSSNINFSTEATNALLLHLTSQAGPPDKMNDPLREVHQPLQDIQFATRLIEQLVQRAEAIASNFRESFCMDTLLTLLLRVWSCAISRSIRHKAAAAIERVRNITYEWVVHLRNEIHQITDAEASKRCSLYSVWASLLCRRTFMPFVKRNDNVADMLPSFALQCFIECSIMLQDNLIGEPQELTPVLRNALVRDTKMVFKIRYILRQSLQNNPETVDAVLGKIWPLSDGSIRSCSPLKFDNPAEWWITCFTKGTANHRSQNVSYNLLSGHFLIDSKPLGSLPVQHQESTEFKKIFGNRKLLIYPSGLAGMSFQVAHMFNNHEIHIGHRNERTVVQACFQGNVYEYVPDEIFGNMMEFDLPAPLVDGCVHLLNLDTGMMEIRQRPDIWISKQTNWQLDCNSKMAQCRGAGTLVDPYSGVFRQITGIFKFFEHARHIVVSQPARKHLAVELLRLDLSFHVLKSGFLLCHQLQAFVDRDQDAGTWYGCDSKIVLRDAKNLRQRSIIVPLGFKISSTKTQFHMGVNIEPAGLYGRFTINNVLGRLDCPPEPWLLYTKAMLHAYTSSVVPDGLTGRTGIEESIAFLRSAKCQPWTTLGPGPLSALISIAALTPVRQYYPKDLKLMQEIFWKNDVPFHCQRGDFRLAIEEIYAKHAALNTFALQGIDVQELESPGEWHLLIRDLVRRRPYDRPTGHKESFASTDMVYESRGRTRMNLSRLNVYESVQLLAAWPSTLSTTHDLAGILTNWPTVGGFDRIFDKVLLSDHLSVQLGTEFGPLVNLCRNSGPDDKHSLMFHMAMIAFRGDINMDVMRTLISFVILEELKDPNPPQYSSYTEFRANQIPSLRSLVQLINPCRIPYVDDQRSAFGGALSTKTRRQFQKAELAHQDRTDKDCRALAQDLLEQWPCAEPSMERLQEPLLLNMKQARDKVLPEWLRLFQNFKLSAYVQDIQRVLDRHHPQHETRRPPSKTTAATENRIVLPMRFRGGELVSLPQELLRKSGPVLFKGDGYTPSGGYSRQESVKSSTQCMGQFQYPLKESTLPLAEIQELDSIVKEISSTISTVKRQYGHGLGHSLEAFNVTDAAREHKLSLAPPMTISSEIVYAQQSVKAAFSSISSALEQDDSRIKWLIASGLFPRITPVTLLEQLSSTSIVSFGQGMKRALSEYALSITNLQRLLRIEDAYHKSNKQRLGEEEANPGHSNWNPFDNVDWLLLEVDANLLIRRDQIKVANATISPPSGANSVLQLMMGQGKTSCIMPMAAATMANGKRLCKVIVPRALITQTAQLLVDRLGGLLNREVRHIPFSRKTPTGEDTIKQFHEIHKHIMSVSGVIVALPEHVMSFMLSGMQRLSDGKLHEASRMVKVQNWLNRVSCDILDEADAILATKTQLIYPSGGQTTVDGHPHRWETTQALLRLVHGHLGNLQRDFPRSIEVLRRGDGFPQVFFLRKDVEDALLERLVRDILHGQQTNIVPVQDCTPTDKVLIKQFISVPNFPAALYDRIHSLFPDKPAIRQNIYLLRGLLVHRILLLTLKRRWNVQYGLHPLRDPVAVPFHAKGVPSEQAEWGHPDVQIAMTCLSFYFGGLSSPQLKQSVENLLKSDDPSAEYDRWTIQSHSLPDSLRDWNVINVDDEMQMKELWSHLRYRPVVIDYFMNHFVFPKHAKQFKLKLQVSGWDLPLLSGGPHFANEAGGSSKRRLNLTTGFSGTNDVRALLPLTIKQEDLPGLSHTNAEVLCYLLQPRNRRYRPAADMYGKRLSEVELLQHLSVLRIRVLIDAGAYILEMENYTLAAEWLRADGDAAAAIYFEKDNRPWVLYRRGHKVPLSSSPYIESIPDNVLVYLDEGHTRGTDMKLGAKAVGALTLGLGNSKDHIVQAAMRLRQLGTTQSVVFFAPPEVHQSILDFCQKRPTDLIDSHHVILWLLEQTCIGIESLQPLFHSHGSNFCRRMQAALNNPDFLTVNVQRDAYLGVLRQNEQLTLEQLYGVRKKIKAVTTRFSPGLSSMMKDLETMRKGFQDNGHAVGSAALQEVEQERETEQEVENVREVQRPVHYTPLAFGGLHKDIIGFVETGRTVAQPVAYEDAFGALRYTALGSKHGIRPQAVTGRLKVTREFMKTVSVQRPNDNFLRQVNYLLWSMVEAKAMIISPEEAELVIPLTRNAESPHTYFLTYAAPVTRKMLHFGDLKYYTIPLVPYTWTPPKWLTVELGLFAGRLYFEFEEYNTLCEYLGIHEEGVQLVENIENITADEAHEADNSAASDEEDCSVTITSKAKMTPFTASPLTFMSEWLAIRRRGAEFHHTPLGYICQGKPLTANHPFFSKAYTTSTVQKPRHIMHTSQKPDNTAGEPDVAPDDDITSDEDEIWFDVNEEGLEDDWAEEPVEFESGSSASREESEGEGDDDE